MIRRAVVDASAAVARAERVICLALLALLLSLILLNVVTRAMNIALFWVDELAVYTMIWMAFFGGSLLLHERRHVAVTMLTGALSDNRRRVFFLLADLVVLLVCAGLLAMCVQWYDIAGLAEYEFDKEEFAASTYNFIYQEPTNTLGVQKYWLWAVVPIVSIAMTIHALANLLGEMPGRTEA